MTLERKVVRSPAAQRVGGRHYEGKEILLALANFETGVNFPCHIPDAQTDR